MFNKIWAFASFLIVGFTCMVFYSFGEGNPFSKEVQPSREVTYHNSPVVIELFTSQGCSSCPPADVLLQKVKKQHPEQVFALSYHVDYWNYIGWKDPFSKSQFTKRQSLYNQKLGYRGNYTPEVVINGREHFVGSNSSKMMAKIAQYQKDKAKVNIILSEVSREGNQVSFTYKVEGNSSEQLLRAVLVLDERTTSVQRGENRNRTLTNSNIVVNEKYIDFSLNSDKAEISIPAWIGPNEALTMMLISETDDMDVTGAEKIKV